mmetsp:Transcript_57091/g.100248  ORF Transcript_57091/g.100248 Transcript_57091/m.100248 type:complete len:235 (-) Transcript_57091:503-1207(-)
MSTNGIGIAGRELGHENRTKLVDRVDKEGRGRKAAPPVLSVSAQDTPLGHLRIGKDVHTQPEAKSTAVHFKETRTAGEVVDIGAVGQHIAGHPRHRICTENTLLCAHNSAVVEQTGGELGIVPNCGHQTPTPCEIDGLFAPKLVLGGMHGALEGHTRSHFIALRQAVHLLGRAEKVRVDHAQGCKDLFVKEFVKRKSGRQLDDVAQNVQIEAVFEATSRLELEWGNCYGVSEIR